MIAQRYRCLECPHCFRGYPSGVSSADLLTQQKELNAQEPKRTELEAVQVNIRHVEHVSDEIAGALIKAKGRVPDSLARQQDEVNASYDALSTRKAELATRRLTDSAVDDILTYARDVREGIENATKPTSVAFSNCFKSNLP